METFRTKLAPGGRIVVPADLRRALGLKQGDEVLMRLEDGQVWLYTRAQAIREAQELVRKAAGVSMVDDLLKERRLEVENEETEAAASRTGRAAPKTRKSPSRTKKAAG